MGSHWLLLTILGFTFGGALIFLGWWSYRRLFLKPMDGPRWKAHSLRQRLPFWQRGDVAVDYELINRHET